MSGHSKWSTIKHKKAAQDARRGRLFTRRIKELTVAARLGGSDPAGNPRLRTAIDNARSANMPVDNIKRAIQKGSGELDGISYEEVAYEGYGPGGVAIFLETVTDNRMRTTPEIRHIFSKHGCALGEPNSVAWIFERRGRLTVDRSATTEDRLMEVVLDAGGEDLQLVDEHYEISTPPELVHEVKQALEQAEIPVGEAALVREPSNTVHVEGKKAQLCLKLLDALEEQDDVQSVYANLEVDDDTAQAG